MKVGDFGIPKLGDVILREAPVFNYPIPDIGVVIETDIEENCLVWWLLPGPGTSKRRWTTHYKYHMLIADNVWKEPGRNVVLGER